MGGVFCAVRHFFLHIYRTILDKHSFFGLLGHIIINLIFILIWITTFKNAWRIDASIRPLIDVNYLEMLDKRVFGSSPFGIASQFTCSVIGILWMYTLTRKKMSILAGLPPLLLNILYSLSHNLSEPLDVFAWLSYGVIHFISPFFAAFWLWLFAPPGVVSIFAWSFGIQNCLGVITHLSFPTAAPWYGDQYGYPLPPGNYSMPGSAAGLVRVDKVLGTHIYANAFKASPLVFGAFPSLHGAFSCCCFFFISRYSKKGTFALGFYVLWQWFSTMYLRHHWRIDLLGGLAYSAFAFSLFYRSLQKIDRAYATGVSGGNGWQRLWEGAKLQYWFERRPSQSGYEVLMQDYESQKEPSHEHRELGIYSPGSSSPRAGTPGLQGDVESAWLRDIEKRL